VSQAISARNLPVDYIAIGPVFDTSSKENPDTVVGLDIIRQVRREIDKPLVAIGGITLLTVPDVWAAGADSVAIISDLYIHGDISLRMREFYKFLPDR